MHLSVRYEDIKCPIPSTNDIPMLRISPSEFLFFYSGTKASYTDAFTNTLKMDVYTKEGINDDPLDSFMKDS